MNKKHFKLALILVVTKKTDNLKLRLTLEAETYSCRDNSNITFGMFICGHSQSNRLSLKQAIIN